MPKVKDFIFVKSPRGITAVREDRKILRNKNRIVDDMDQAFPDGIFTDPTGLFLISVLEIWTNTARQLGKNLLN